MIRWAMGGDISQCVVRQASSLIELEQALRLVHDCYVDRGYMRQQPSQLRLCVQDALPDTCTVVALLRGNVIGTVSLFLDSPLGLPLDSLYQDELDELRRQGRRLGEVGMLADRRRVLLRSLPLVLKMMKIIFWTARKRTLDDLIIAVNPRHVAFYSRLLCFKQFSEIRYYGAVSGAPAVPMRLNLAALDPARVQRHIRELFFSPLSDDLLSDTPYRIDTEGFRYLFVERTGMLRSLSRVQLNEIQKHYPDINFDTLLCTRKGG